MDTSTFTAHFKGERPFMGATDVRDVLCSLWSTPEDPIKVHRSPFQVQQEKLGNMPPVKANRSMVRGTRLEPYILDLYNEDTGRTVAPRLDAEGKSLRVLHPVNPWLAATPDFWSAELDHLVEAKSHRAEIAREYGETGSDDIPFRYIVQVMMQLHVVIESSAGTPDKSDLYAYFGGDDTRLFTIPYNKELAQSCESQIVEWVQHYIVEKRVIVPDSGDTDVISRMYAYRRPHEGKPVDATPEINDAIAYLREFSPSFKAQEKEIEQRKNLIKAFLIDNEATVLRHACGGKDLTYKAPKGSVSYKALVADLNPPQELIDRHTPEFGAPRLLGL